jgi:MFS transporter, NNP family, nitrate/nitrite transporter
MANTVDAAGAETHARYQLSGTPTLGLTMGTWGFFVGFAAVALYGPAAKYFQEQMNLGGLTLGSLRRRS